MVSAAKLPEFVGSFRVTGNGKNREVICGYCGSGIRRSVVPHLRKTHPAKWRRIGLTFVRLYNEGSSSKTIMKRFGTMFTWKVIEQEIMRLSESKGIPIVPHNSDSFVEWHPRNFRAETKSVWFFPIRGGWAVHKGDYRGNWAPQVPRNIILHYSRRGDTVLDTFVGGGTTLIETWLLRRRGIGLDINPFAIAMTKKRLREMQHWAHKTHYPLSSTYKPQVRMRDASKLGFLKDASVDLICTQPPYSNALKYTIHNPSNLSYTPSVEKFCDQLEEIAREFMRVLKRGKRCAILMGDIRRNRMMVPLGFLVMTRFQKAGFQLEDIVIKKQHSDKSSQFYSPKNRKFHFEINHEYLFVLRKPRRTSLVESAPFTAHRAH